MLNLPLGVGAGTGSGMRPFDGQRTIELDETEMYEGGTFLHQEMLRLEAAESRLSQSKRV